MTTRSTGPPPKSGSTGANRPVRRRNSVSHYSDDNPNTFTVKNKQHKGETSQQPEVVRQQQTAAISASSSLAASSSSNRQQKRRRDHRSSNSRSSPNSFAALAVKSKSKVKSADEPDVAAAAAAVSTKAGYYGLSSFPRKRNKGGAESTDAASTGPPPPLAVPEQQQPKQSDDTILAHCVAIQPILPLNVLLVTAQQQKYNNSNNNMSSSSTSGAQVLSDSRITPYSSSTATSSSSNNMMMTQKPPVWKPVQQQQQQQQHQQSNITWFSLRSDDGDYAVVGDCLGTVSLYRLGDNRRIRPLRVLHSSSAAARERERVLTSKKIISYPNAVVQCSWCRAVVVVLTGSELEVLQISNGGNSGGGAAAAQQQSILLASYPVTTALQETSQTAKKIAAQQSPCLQLTHHDGATTTTNNTATAAVVSMTNYQILWTTWHRELTVDNKGSNSLLLFDLDVDELSASGRIGDCGIDAGLMGIALTATSAAASDVTIKKLVLSAAAEEQPLFRCWTTLWEQRADSNKTFLMIAQTGPETIELLRGRRRVSAAAATTTTVASSSTASVSTDQSCPEEEPMEILARQTLPYSAGRGGCYNNNLYPADLLPVSDCCLQQFQQHTFVSGSAARGIRMFLSDTLEPVAAFGETVQLHGKLVLWNRCAWVKAGTVNKSDIRVDSVSNSSGVVSSSSSTGATASNSNAAAAVSKKKQVWWLERSDELAARESSKKLKASARVDGLQNGATSANGAGDNDDDEYWLIGIPHPYKGPAELKTTLYLWKPGVTAAAESTTTATLHGPVGGCNGDVYVSPGCGRMVSVGAETGQLYEWGPTLRTDFAGVMYPVGYKVITDNLEYIEDEDELDQVLVIAAMEEEEDYQEDKSEIMTTEIDEAIDPDLAEAMRLSLLEHNRQQMNLDTMRMEATISVLPDVDDDNEFMVPCWPESAGGDGDDMSSPGSPQRGHTFSSTGMLDEKNAFEHFFLEALPQTVSIRNEVKTVAQKRVQQQEAAESAASATDKPKSKGKRTRTANVEVLLQSSIDSDLRLRMGKARGTWANGQGSSLPTSEIAVQYLPSESSAPSTARASPANDEMLIEPPSIERETDPVAIVQAASAEEKALAMELLLLSPSGASHENSNALEVAGAPSIALTDTNSSSSGLGPASSVSPDVSYLRDTIVTLSESNLAHASGASTRHVTESRFVPMAEAAGHAEPEICAACLGRMVLHICGMREKPIDYEAMARADQDRKDREAAEKHRARAEKRRIAEAKRRETRRHKKIEEERKRIEEAERLRRVEVQRFRQSNVRETVYPEHDGWVQQESNESPYTHARLPRDSPAREYHQHPQTYAPNDQNESDDSEADDYESDRSHDRTSDTEGSRADSYPPARQDASPVHRDVITIDGNEVKPSTSLHPIDALAALAGLADSMAQTVPMDVIPQHRSDAPNSTDERGTWLSNGAEEYTSRSRPQVYEYHGSDERRANITHAFTATVQEDSSSNGYGYYAAQHPGSANTMIEQHQNTTATRMATTLTGNPNVSSTWGNSEPYVAAVAHVDYREITSGHEESAKPTAQSLQSQKSEMAPIYGLALSEGALLAQPVESPMDQAILLTQMANTVATHPSQPSDVHPVASVATPLSSTLLNGPSVAYQPLEHGSDRAHAVSQFAVRRQPAGPQPSVPSALQITREESQEESHAHQMPQVSQEESQAHALLALAFSASPKHSEIPLALSETEMRVTQTHPDTASITWSSDLASTHAIVVAEFLQHNATGTAPLLEYAGSNAGLTYGYSSSLPLQPSKGQVDTGLPEASATELQTSEPLEALAPEDSFQPPPA